MIECLKRVLLFLITYRYVQTFPGLVEQLSKISAELSIDSFAIQAQRFTSVIRLSREPGCETRDRHEKAAQIRNELVSAVNLSN